MSLLVTDIGGSAVKYGLCDGSGTLCHTGAFPVPDSLISFLDQLEPLVQQFQPEGIALSSPGSVDPASGMVHGISAVPWIHGPSLTQELQKRFSLPVTIENDANCAALAELWLGAACDLKDCCFVIFGTGIGGALVQNRKLIRGATMSAGEFGLMILDYDIETQSYHVWSRYSTNHTVRNAEQECGLKEHSLDGITLFENKDNNPIFTKHIEYFYNAAANGFLNLQQMYDPEAIIVGGGISARTDLKEQILRRIAVRIKGRENYIPVPQIRICRFRNDANLIGAAYHFLLENS